MTIAEAREKCKSAISKMPRDVLIMIVLILASLFSFGLGYLSGKDAGKVVHISLESSPPEVVKKELVTNTSNMSQSGTIVASRNGTKYYLPECAGAKRIVQANKVWFASASDALAAGYSPATNCKGI